MPNIKSAKKRLRQSLVRRERNRSTKRALRTECRKVTDALQSGDLEQAGKQFRLVAKKLDQAAAKRIVHANAAARTKSRLSARIKARKQAAAAPAS